MIEQTIAQVYATVQSLASATTSTKTKARPKRTPLEGDQLEIEPMLVEKDSDATIGVVTDTSGRKMQKQIICNDWNKPTQIIKKSAATPYKGTFCNVPAHTAAALGNVLDRLTPYEGICLGSSGHPLSLDVPLGTKSHVPAGGIARTKSFLHWPLVFWMLVDIDPEPGAVPLTRDQTWAKLCAMYPGWAYCAHVWKASSSSHISLSEDVPAPFLPGAIVTSEGNYHLYLRCRGDVDAWVLDFTRRCWLSGNAFHKLATKNAKTGVSAVLERFFVDATVFSPERIIYEAGADLGPGLVQKRPPAITTEGDTFDLDAITPLSGDDIAKADRLKNEARAAIIATRLAATIDHLIKTDKLDKKTAETEAQRRIAYCDRGILAPDHIITVEGLGAMRVGDLTPEMCGDAGLRCFDPQEPDYRPGDYGLCLAYYNRGELIISSKAHGKRIYGLALDAIAAFTAESLQAAIDALNAGTVKVSRDSTEVKAEANKLGINAYKLFRAVELAAQNFDVDWLFDHLPLDAKAHKKAERQYRKDLGLDDDQRRSMPDQLIDIGLGEGINYFKTPEGTIHADLNLEGHRETVGLRSKGFRQYLRATIFERSSRSPGADAVTQAIDTLEALASRDALERKLSNRTAQEGDDIYIDLGDDAWHVVKITSEGWEVVADYPVRFRRGGCAAMPTPIAGGSLEAFRALCQFDQSNWIKILCWIVQSMMPAKEYPILILSGARGSGKTSITKAIKSLIDPTNPLTRGTVGDVRSFAIHATKRHCIAIDNLSGLTPEQSDILCRAATGGGHAERTLQTDDDETIFEFTNPLILNGIGSIATRDDLLDRSMVVGLQQVADRISQGEFERRLEAMLPGVFGALLDLMVRVLAMMPELKGTYDGEERFTGFMEVSLAVERAMAWAPGTVLGVFGESRADAHLTAVESSPLGLAVLDFMANQTYWTGPAGELLNRLSLVASEKTVRDRSWPGNGKWLSDRLINRLAPDLAALGIEVTRDRSNGSRGITIKKITPTAQKTPQPAPVEIKEGDQVVLITAEYEAAGLQRDQTFTIASIQLPQPNATPPIPEAFAVLAVPDGKNESVWLKHLKPYTESADLGFWGAAA